jgi:putative IMPACT (imprinted ancient) family translation regulator
MNDCSKHKKDIAGITDMKVLAEMIGDLHYETLAELFKELSKKFNQDSRKDWKNKRVQLSIRLKDASISTKSTFISINQLWQISEPFMIEQNPASGNE